MYSVTFTEYDDDYKHRYDDGIYPEPPKLFKKEDDANKYITKEIYDRINNNLSGQDYEYENLPKRLKKYFRKQNDYIAAKIKKDYKNNFTVLKKIYDELMTGEFVDYLFDWSLDKVEIN